MIGLKSITTKLGSQIGNSLIYDLTVEQLEIAADTESVILNQTKVDYSMHVIPLEEDGIERSTTGMSTSKVDVQIGVLIGIKDVSDATGSDVQDPLKEYREAVSKVLTGFTPDGATRPMIYSGGRLIQIKDGIYWQLDSYSVGYNIRQVL